MSLTTLPAHYRAALADSGSSWTALAASISGAGVNADSVLMRIDSVLAAVNARLVVFIEDLDRNSPSPNLLTQVQALLDRIRRKLARVSFVLAVSYESKSNIDWTKLCDKMEVIPSLSPTVIGPVLARSVDYCLTRFPRDITPADFDRSAALEPFGEPGKRSFITDEAESEQPFASVRLIHTPRRLKQTLRDVRDIWENIHGEINFQDVMILCALRACTPDAFRFLLQNMERLRTLDDPLHDESSRTRLDADLQEDWNATTKDTPEVDRRHAMVLVTALIPFWKGGTSDDPNRFVGQHVDRAEITDYWQRFNAESVIGPEDQTVLRMIVDWKSQPQRPDLPEQLLASELSSFVDKFQQFAGGAFSPDVTLAGDEVRQLATDLIQRLIARDGVSADMCDSDGLIALRNLAAHGKKYKSHRRWLWNELKKTLESSARLGASMLRQWTAQQLDYSWGQSGNRRRLYRAMFAWIKRHWSNDGIDKMLNALDPSYPWTLHHLVRANREDTNTVITAKDWSWFAPTLLSAAAIDPELIVPQIAALICSGNDHFENDDEGSPTVHVRVYDLDDSFIAAMFGTGMMREQLLQLLSIERQYTKLSGDHLKMAQSIQRSSQRRLEMEADVAETRKSAKRRRKPPTRKAKPSKKAPTK